MSIPLNIQGTIIQFPSNSQDPSWAPAVIQFAEAVTSALSGLAGTFDVPPQVFVIDAYNPGTNISIPNLSFPTSNVRSAVISYDVYRTASTPTTTAVEAGQIIIVFDTSAGTWSKSQERVGDGKISFSITNAGQVQFTTTQIGTTSHTGQIAFSAKSLSQT